MRQIWLSLLECFFQPLERFITVIQARVNNCKASGYVINWKFLDSMGRVIAQSDGRVFLPTDQFRSFDVNGDSLDVERDRFGRIELRAVVTAIGNPEEKNLKVSVEVIDNTTGKTTVFCQNNL